MLPTDRAARKAIPLYSGCLTYFPNALAEVAKRSKEGNDQHNPDEPLHWARGKSNDHLDCLARHLIEGDLVGVAWRALAALQLQCEAEGAPVAPGAREGGVETRDAFDIAFGFPADDELSKAYLRERARPRDSKWRDGTYVSRPDIYDWTKPFNFGGDLADDGIIDWGAGSGNFASFRGEPEIPLSETYSIPYSELACMNPRMWLADALFIDVHEPDGVKRIYTRPNTPATDTGD